MTNPVIDTGSKSTMSSIPATASNIEEELARRTVFQQLQPLCSKLLPLRNSAPGLSAMLQRLKAVVSDADAPGLRGCMDYALFPLSFGVDSIAATRQPGDQAAARGVAIPAAGADSVAEALLDCCAALLHRCPVHSSDQLLELLERFARVASLPGKAAAEEVRLKAVECMNALLSSTLETQLSSLTATLRAPNKAQLVAFLMFSLIKASEEEVQMGLTGSKALSAAALRAVGLLVRAVGDGDLLAPVLPGLASGLVKVMLAAGGTTSRKVSGSKAGSHAVAEALHAFSLIVCATLGDAYAQSTAQSTSVQAELSASEALHALQQMALQPRQSQADGTSTQAGSEPIRQSAGQTDSKQGVRSKAWLQASSSKLHQLIVQGLPPLLTHPRTAVRVALAKATIQLLDKCSSALHDSNEVLFEVVFTLAQDDWPQVSALTQSWLNAWLPHSPNTALPSHEIDARAAAVQSIVARLQAGLPAALRGGEQGGTLHARRLTTALQACPARQLTTLLTVGPASAASWAAVLTRCFAFERSAAALLMHNTSAAGPHAMLSVTQSSLPSAAPSTTAPAQPIPPSYCSPADTPVNTPSEPCQEPQPDQHSQAVLQSQQISTDWQKQQQTQQLQPADQGQQQQPQQEQDQQKQQQQQPQQQQQHRRDEAGRLQSDVVLLPRMALGLSHITSNVTYAAVAGVARTLGRTAAAADSAEAQHAGGTALPDIVQEVLQLFQAQLPPHVTNVAQGSLAVSAPDTESMGWQCKAASAVMMLSEVLFGASAAWDPACPKLQSSHPQQHTHAQQHLSHSQQASPKPQGLTSHPPQQAGPPEQQAGESQPQTSNPQQQASQSQPPANPLETSADSADPQEEARQGQAMHAELEGLVAKALQEFDSSGVWRLVTHQEMDMTSNQAAALTPQVLGESAVLISALLEAVGTFARILGPSFASKGLFVRTSLLLLLERLADPCPLVASSAGLALGSLCLHCGYPSRQALLAGNADYLVEGLCRQLRSIATHPRAPYLFAAVLQQAGAGREVLPLLSDPARAAFLGLSITARHNRSFHIYPFLQVLLEITKICLTEAAALLTNTQQLAEQIKQALEARKTRVEEDADIEEIGGGDDANIEDVRQYFEEHHAGRRQEQAELEATVNPGADVLEQIRDNRRRIHSVAVLAHASADVANPLLLSATLKVGVLALKVGQAGLQALQATSAALDLYDQIIEPHATKQDGVQPTPPDTPQMLPSVHAIWSPLMGALKDSRVALVQAALQFLVELCHMGGAQFMLRRFQTEAWPILLHLLKHGTYQQQQQQAYMSLSPGRRVIQANGSVQQIRQSVLRCMQHLATSGTKGTVWKGLTDQVAQAVVPYLDGAQSAAVKAASAQAVLSIAMLDPDAVWLMLAQQSTPVAGSNPNVKLFPDTATLLKRQKTTGSSLQQNSSSAAVAALLQKVEAISTVPWHLQMPED